MVTFASWAPARRHRQTSRPPLTMVPWWLTPDRPSSRQAKGCRYGPGYECKVNIFAHRSTPCAYMVPTEKHMTENRSRGG